MKNQPQILAVRFDIDQKEPAECRFLKRIKARASGQIDLSQ